MHLTEQANLLSNSLIEQLQQSFSLEQISEISLNNSLEPAQINLLSQTTYPRSLSQLISLDLVGLISSKNILSDTTSRNLSTQVRSNKSNHFLAEEFILPFNTVLPLSILGDLQHHKTLGSLLGEFLEVFSSRSISQNNIENQTIGQTNYSLAVVLAPLSQRLVSRSEANRVDMSKTKVPFEDYLDDPKKESNTKQQSRLSKMLRAVIKKLLKLAN